MKDIINSNNKLFQLLKNSIDGLGAIDADNLLKYIVETQKVIQTNPQLYSSVQNYENLIQMFNYAIEYWNTEKRIQALQLL